MKRPFSLSISIVLVFSLVILVPQFIFAKAPEGSKIANVLVEGKSETDIYTDLADRVSQWLSSDDFILTSEYERLTLPRDIFEFDIQGTVDQFQEETEQSFFSFFKKEKSVQLPLKVFVKQNHPDIQHLQSLDYINSEQMIKQLLNMAKNLEADSVNIEYNDEINLPFAEVAAHKLPIPDELSYATIKNIAKDLNEQMISPMETFSYLNALELPDSLKDSNEELSFVATGLYEAILQTNMAIIKRQHHLQLPKYANRGLDVFIHQSKQKDFVTQNNNHTAYQIKATLEDRELHVSIHSLEQPFIYDYNTENEETIKPRTIYRYSKDLSPGETELIQEGEDGFSIEVYRTTLSHSDEVLTSERISKDIYLPTPKIVLTSTEDAPEESESTVDPDEISDELDDIEQSLGDFNEWLTGDTNSDELSEDITLRPFFYLIPSQFLPFLTDQNEDFAERFAKLEQMIQNNESLNEELIIERLVDLELRLETLKEQYEKIVDILVEHDLLEKGDE